MQRIQNKKGDWLEEQNYKAEAAVAFFQKQFSKKVEIEDFTISDELPTLVTE